MPTTENAAQGTRLRPAAQISELLEQEAVLCGGAV
jgi:hypothetical protein